MKKVLLINSDLAKNRGDRAIAEGNIRLIKQQFKDVHISGISQFPKRDTKWYDIDFVNMNFQSLSPFELFKLARIAKQNDIVLWGGGEILKDYTNKAALWYWVIKMTLLSLFNKNLYGAYQGIGPTKSEFSKKLIVFVVKRCRKFIVRDKESFEKLVKWGAPKENILFASDPAVLPVPDKINDDLKKNLKKNFDIDEEFLKDFICIGPRDWFHYKPGGIIPFKYKKKMYKIFGKKIDTSSKKHTLYLDQLSTMISELTKKYKTNVLLVPMHMEESDTKLCEFLKENSTKPSSVRILDKDTLSPSQLRSVVARAKAMIGFRLHSNIIGISAGVPSVNIYYVDKGRVFFDQINQSKFAISIDETLKPGFVKKLIGMFDDLYKNRTKVEGEIKTATNILRKDVEDSFKKVFDEQKES